MCHDPQFEVTPEIGEKAHGHLSAHLCPGPGEIHEVLCLQKASTTQGGTVFKSGLNI